MDILKIEYPTDYKLMVVLLSDGTSVHILPEIDGDGWFVVWYPPDLSVSRGGSWLHCDDREAITIIRKLMDQERVEPRLHS